MKDYSNELKCEKCQKTTTIGNNKPNSLHKTKREIKPNLQINNKRLICTRCLKKN